MRDSLPLSRILGGVLLVAGTTIGAAMLALPVSTGLAGFVPAISLILVYWALMFFTGFLLLEVNLRSPREANFFHMAEDTLGPLGRLVTWISYTFLLYCLLTAYLAASSRMLLSALPLLPDWSGFLLVLGVFALFVALGTRMCDLFNRLLMASMALLYLFIVALLYDKVQPELLTYRDWPWLLASLSVVATSFGYHIIIPTLVEYLDRDVRALRITLAIGSSVPLIIYLIWETLTLGSIPVTGPEGLFDGWVNDRDSASLLAYWTQHPGVAIAARLFAFLAILTSFLGVSMSLWDCLADSFGFDKQGRGRVPLFFLTFIPPLLFSITFSRVFFTALEYAGAYGVVVLLGIIPALMVWNQRKQQPSYETHYQAPGGKGALIAVWVLCGMVILAESAVKLGLFVG